MTKQYKNPFEDPEAELWGEKIKDYKIPERKETPLEEKVTNLEGFIYVPSIKLYVAKQKSLHGLSWEDAHKELHKQGLQMLTIKQFIDFVLYLKQNPYMLDAKQILDEVLTKRQPLRREWLDAMFSKEAGLTWSGVTFIKEADADMQGYPGIVPSAKPKGGIDYPDWSDKKAELYIHYNHRTENGKFVAKNIESLEECLMEDCHIDLKDCNKQGLPTKRGNDIWFVPPREGCAAGFGAGLSKAVLCCEWNPVNPDSSIGVRAAKVK